MRTIMTRSVMPLLLALAGVAGAGCSGDAAHEAPDLPPGTQADEASATMPAELEALPTVEEVEQDALEQINADNMDEALRALEAELDADPGGG